MNEAMRCPTCQGEMKLVPAGISKKSGKPYDAFWGCKTYGCKGTIRIQAGGPPASNFSSTGPSGSPRLTLDNQEAKEMRITKLAVLKSAMEGGLIQKIDETEEAFLERWIKWVYKNTQHDKDLTTTDIPF